MMLKILPSKIRGFTHPIKPYTLSLSLFGEAFFFIGETFATKWNYKFKIQKWSDFGGFQLPEVRKQKVKNSHIYISV
jgi:hypothetical protein